MLVSKPVLLSIIQVPGYYICILQYSFKCKSYKLLFYYTLTVFYYFSSYNNKNLTII